MPSWDPEVTGKDSSGNTITIQKCTNWDSGKAISCNQPPKTAVKWIKCGLGSSPGGLSPWDKATLCSPYTNNFDCTLGKNCYAVTSFTPKSSTTTKAATTKAAATTPTPKEEESTSTWTAIKEKNLQVRFLQEIFLSPEDLTGFPNHKGKDTWWNGVSIFVLEKSI